MMMAVFPLLHTGLLCDREPTYAQREHQGETDIRKVVQMAPTLGISRVEGSKDAG